jgi:hypothetical protein
VNRAAFGQTIDSGWFRAFDFERKFHGPSITLGGARILLGDPAAEHIPKFLARVLLSPGRGT